MIPSCAFGQAREECKATERCQSSFSASYNQGVSFWQSLTPQQEFNVLEQVSNKFAETDMLGFADDLCRVILMDIDWATALDKKVRIDQTLHTTCQLLDLIKILEKMDVVLKTCGYDGCTANEHMQNFLKKHPDFDGNSLLALLYLCVDINGQGGLNAEIDRRLAAAKIAWHAMRGLWRCGAFRIKRMVYLCLVVHSLLCGLEPLPLKDTHFVKLERFQCRCLRRLLQGKAHVVTGEIGSHNTMTNTQVRSKCAVHSLQSMWYARRCRWLQKMARGPGEHMAALAALHAQLPWDDGPQLGPRGRKKSRTNAVLANLLETLEMVENAEIKIKIALSEQGWLGIFDQRCNGDFVRFDPNKLQMYTFHETHVDRQNPVVCHVEGCNRI